jgi:hypothetical protein
LTKSQYKVGEEVVFFKYTNIKGVISNECITVYDHTLYFSDNSPVSDVDFYFKTKDTIVAIIPDVPPGEDYSIAFKISPNSDSYLYSKRFNIIPGGKVKKLPTMKDACGIKRVSIFGEVVVPSSKTVKANKQTSKASKATNKQTSKTIIASKTITTSITTSSTTASVTSTETAQKSQNSNNKYNEKMTSVDNEVKATSDNLKQNSQSNENKSNWLNHLIVFVTGVCFCGLFVIGYSYVNKKGKKEKSVISENRYYDDKMNGYISLPKESNNNNIAFTILSDNEYKQNIKNNNYKDLNHNHSIDIRNINVNDYVASDVIPNKFNNARNDNNNVDAKLLSSPQLDKRFTLLSNASLVPSSHLFSSATSTSLQNYPVNSPSVNVLEPIETPSTEIKFVATSSYQPKNNNEISISTLDIIYVVGYIDEEYAQILNITTNNYGIISISELNKIQP